MNGVLMFLASNAIVATALLGIGLIADRFLRWPAVRHLVWAAVLLQLLLPPVISIGVSLPERPVAESGASGSVQAAARSNEEALPAPAATGTAEVDAAREPGNAAGTGADSTAGATPAPPGDAARLSYATALVAIELTGAALFLGLALTRVRRMAQLVRSTEPAPDELRQRARRLAACIGLRTLPRLRVTDERLVPMLVALPIPTIVLSRPLIEALGSDELDALLCHELAHVRRGDAWLRPVELFATALYWWLPTLWVARRRLRRAEEAACDTIVVSVKPAAKRAYAESLLKAIELTSPSMPSVLVTGAADSGHIKERITMILKNSDKQAPRGALRLAAAFAALSVLVGPSWAPAQQTQAESQGQGQAQSQPQPQPQPQGQGQPQAEPQPQAQAQTQPQAQAQAQDDQARSTRLGTDRRRLERVLIEMRLQAYTIENRIQQMELRHEMARVTELLEQLDDGSAMNAGQVNQGRRELERLELQREHLDVQLDIHRIEAELAMEAYGLAAAGVSGARTAP